MASQRCVLRSVEEQFELANWPATGSAAVEMTSLPVRTSDYWKHRRSKIAFLTYI